MFELDENENNRLQGMIEDVRAKKLLQWVNKLVNNSWVYGWITVHSF